MAEKEKIIKKKKGFSKRVSLFKPRKKPQTRHLVREYKNHNYKKLLINVILVIIIVFILVTALFIVRNIFLQEYLIEKTDIQTPLASQEPDDNQLENIIQNHGLDVSGIQFSTTSATIAFKLNGIVNVLISKDKRIESQLDLVETISKQVKSEGKEVIYIDLRYNNPIVKLQ